jgi:hypothetical protein
MPQSPLPPGIRKRGWLGGFAGGGVGPATTLAAGVCSSTKFAADRGHAAGHRCRHRIHCGGVGRRAGGWKKAAALGDRRGTMDAGSAQVSGRIAAGSTQIPAYGAGPGCRLDRRIQWMRWLRAASPNAGRASARERVGAAPPPGRRTTTRSVKQMVPEDAGAGHGAGARDCPNGSQAFPPGAIALHGWERGVTHRAWSLRVSRPVGSPGAGGWLDRRRVDHP